MKAVIFYELGNVTMEKVREVYPRHKSIVDEFAKDKKIIAIGTFANPTEGSMGVFIDKESAEDFVKQDPFIKEGVVGKVTIKEWNEILLK
ncbi:MAG: YciI family protein [Bacteroidota bacterium]|nr:YciI family protein [Bacteroidota bacterium]